jgi:transcriptional regulator with XRE-family HTH domain
VGLVSTTNNIRARLKALRNRAGLTQAALAARLHSSPKRIANIESGARKPSLELIAAWAEACAHTLVVSFEQIPTAPISPLASELLALAQDLPDGQAGQLLAQHLELWRAACGPSRT